jgi:hypothetical protein
MIPLILEKVSLYFHAFIYSIFESSYTRFNLFHLTLYIIKLLRLRPCAYLFAHDTFLRMGYGQGHG